MKKGILLLMTGLSMGIIIVYAQSDKVAPPPPPPVDAIAPATPEPPIPPTPPPVDAIAPVPPESPIPPPPPGEPGIYCGEPLSRTIVNEKGYETEIVTVRNRDYVQMKKDGKTTKISLTKWLSDKKYYQSKYGQLPPPPPPPPPLSPIYQQ